MSILLTGASGFVGKAVLNIAQHRGLAVRPVFRSAESAKGHFAPIFMTEFDCAADWSNALSGVEVIIHTAARAHIMQEVVLDPLAAYRRINVEGTINLARQAAEAGVRRFVFISSIKVNGEATTPGHPFTADDNHAPEDYYALSKSEAEVLLYQVAQDTGMEVTIIRPPLIYGPGVKGNFANMISWVRRGVPLPLGGVTQNRRSLVGLDNLVGLILVCANHPKAANQTFLVSDGEDLSTTELLWRIGKALNQPANLFWMPAVAISFATGLVGKKGIAKRLLGSLQVDIQKTRELLDWTPSVNVNEGLRRAVE